MAHAQEIDQRHANAGDAVERDLDDLVAKQVQGARLDSQAEAYQLARSLDFGQHDLLLNGTLPVDLDLPGTGIRRKPVDRLTELAIGFLEGLHVRAVRGR